MKELTYALLALAATAATVTALPPAGTTSAAVVYLSPCRQVQFTPTNQVGGLADVRARFQPAVFRLVVNGPGDNIEQGTGFLIDSANGFLLTALHVVKAAAEDQVNVTIEGNNGRLPAPVELELVEKVGAPTDVALLKAKNPQVLKDIRPLDIALDLLPSPPESNYYSVGFPQGHDEHVPETQQVKRGDIVDEGARLEVVQDVDWGMSGSPLIDENGAVVAIALEKVRAAMAHYATIDGALDLLDKIPADVRIQALDREMRADSAGGSFQQRLIAAMKWQAPDAITNLELYTWGRLIAKAPNQYLKERHRYLGCPVIPALHQRRLEEVAYAITTDEDPPEVRAPVMLGMARKLGVSGQWDLASARSMRAVDLYSQLGDSSGQADALTVSGWAALHDAHYDSALTNFQAALDKSGTPAQRAKTKIYLAQAYAWKGDTTKASLYVHDAIPDLGNDQSTKGAAQQTLGWISQKNGDYEAASSQYSEALKLYSGAGDAVGSAALNERLKAVTYELARPSPPIYQPILLLAWARTPWTFGLVFVVVIIMAIAVMGRSSRT